MAEKKAETKKEIIEANDGSITMNSEVGKGTEVIMKIPCNRE